MKSGLDKLFAELAKLLDTKTILTICAAYVFVALAMNGTLSGSEVLVIITMVFQSFFSYQTNKVKASGKDGLDDKQ